VSHILCTYIVKVTSQPIRNHLPWSPRLSNSTILTGGTCDRYFGNGDGVACRACTAPHRSQSMDRIRAVEGATRRRRSDAPRRLDPVRDWPPTAARGRTRRTNRLGGCWARVDRVIGPPSGRGLVAESGVSEWCDEGRGGVTGECDRGSVTRGCDQGVAVGSAGRGRGQDVLGTYWTGWAGGG
jgi:hypothetical protein